MSGKVNFKDLYTLEGEALAKDPQRQPWQAYPRPQLKRDNWINLNGYWDLRVADTPGLPEDGGDARRIRVPFCPESLLSGIRNHYEEGSFLFYTRKVTIPEGFSRGRVLLHIGAADQIADVYVNGRHAGSHEGGYWSFTCDITAFLRTENEIVIRAQDDLRDQSMPYGKQTIKRGGMWYTPVSGIWQTVWMETVPEKYIRSLRIQNGGDWALIDTEDREMNGIVTVNTPEGDCKLPLVEGKARFTTANPRMWSPEDPYLYTFTVETEQDRVESYFALRTLQIRTVNGCRRLCLNGKPYFFHGLLDQGYWSDGLLTPAGPECFARDILAMKKLGFNTLRKHIKLEPEQFYYDCDRLGMIVFQDMVNNGSYSFLRDTALPTIGIQKLPEWFHRDKTTQNRFLQGMEKTVAQLKNHPCICYWTVFNEGWGQFEADRMYERLRELDDSRFIDSTSGWFRRRKTDVDSRHVYFRELKLKAGEKPLVLSEFGGYSCKLENHAFNPDETYGYGKFQDRTLYMQAVEKLYREQVLPLAQRGLCAAIYTQVSDVEDETNGLVTYDRKAEKLAAQIMLPIAHALQQAMTGSKTEG